MSDDKYDGLGLSEEEIAAMEDELSEGEQYAAEQCATARTLEDGE